RDGRLPRRRETARHDDTTDLEVDLADAGVDERQGEPAVELEDVVRRVLRDVDDPPECLAAFLDDLQAAELEDVVGVLCRGREGVARDPELGPSLDAALEPDHRPAAGLPRRDDAELGAVDEDRRADCEASQILARALDEEGAVQPVRAADAAHDDGVRHACARAARRTPSPRRAWRWGSRPDSRSRRCG